MGKYNAFKLVDGETVPNKFKRINIRGCLTPHNFNFHSAGPFGEDIYGDWMSANNFFQHLAYNNLGWKDVHATNIFTPNQLATASILDLFKTKLKYTFRNSIAFLRKYTPNLIKKIKRTFFNRHIN